MKKPASAISLSMLDLISNALGAALILFFVLSVLRLPPIPPERVLGTLVIIIRIEAKNASQNADAEIWLISPQEANLAREFGPDIEKFNDERNAFSYYGVRYDSTNIDAANLAPKVVVYAPVDSPNVRVAIVRDPIKGEWRGGLLYVNHQQYDDDPQPAKAHIEVWFVKEGTSTGILNEEAFFDAPSQWRQIKFTVPEWLGKSS